MIFITIIPVFGTEVQGGTVVQKPAPTVEISANSLTTHIKLKGFRSFFSFLLVRTTFFCVLAPFYKFHWASKVYIYLMQPCFGNRFLHFLEVQILINWVVFGARKFLF